MIPDLDFCGAVRGSTLRGAVVLLFATSARPIALTTSSVFGWCAIFPGLLFSPLIFCPLALFTRASARSKFFDIMNELPIIQKTYDLIKWYVPILNRLPRDHKFSLGNRIIEGLYELLEGLIKARYSTCKKTALMDLNTKIDILRYQTRLLVDFGLMETPRYQFVSQSINAIGIDLGSWIKQQRSVEE